MNIKNLSFVAVVLTGLIVNTAFISAESNNNTRQLRPELLAELRRQQAEEGPRDKTKTPTTPSIIFHDKDQTRRGDLKGRPRNMYNARIYYGTDEDNKPCYRMISEHAENNPEFSKVGLVIYHEAGWFSPETFENIGTVANEDAREKLLDSISDMEGMLWWKHAKGGLWCPAQNAEETGFFIGGTREAGRKNPDGTKGRCMCDVYAEFLKQEPVPSKLTR
ncbi:MAG TPA: hypothetical protein VJJ26_01720 [Candidatus Babeliales bacterium]|nr:hypothetical protein [Candidatus Babeliales bacterium]